MIVLKTYRLVSVSSSSWSSAKLFSKTAGGFLLSSARTSRRPPVVGNRGGWSRPPHSGHSGPHPTRPRLGPGARQPAAARGLLHPPAARLSPSPPRRRMWGIGTAGTGSTCGNWPEARRTPGASAWPAGMSHRSCAYTGAPGDTGDPRWRARNTHCIPGLNPFCWLCRSWLEWNL